MLRRLLKSVHQKNVTDVGNKTNWYKFLWYVYNGLQFTVVGFPTLFN